MKKIWIGLCLVFPICCAACPDCCAATAPFVISEEAAERIETPPVEGYLKDIAQARQYLDNTYGTAVGFLLHYDRQFILSAKDNKGKSGGVCYWNVELLQRLWRGATLVTELETDRGKGVDKFLPTFSSFNTNAGANIDLYLPVLYLQQDIGMEKGFLATGKLDISDWFDGNAVAACGDTQFLSCALVNNLAIPFPPKGLGALLNFKISPEFYLQAGAATARAAITKTGLSDGFNSVFLSGKQDSPRFLKACRVITVSYFI